MIYAILIPVIAGALIKIIPFKKRSTKEFFLLSMIILTGIIVWYLIFNSDGEVYRLVNFTGGLTIAFRIDGLSKIFSGLVSFLWPFATLYAFEYMEKEEREDTFFMFYTMTYSVTLGIAMAANILTLYMFYEFLTLITVPLVMHTLTREAILASRKYLYYSLGGAAFGFIGMIFIVLNSVTPLFTYGGLFSDETWQTMGSTLLIVYFFSFMGFGVKAAVCPFNSWLPAASVAPTPVTALLHAVAVVKSGAFAIIRLTYYCFGVKNLAGTWAQNALLIIVIITIVYGCSMAVKETHFKRRLAYSTISNLSYILFGVLLLSPAGLLGALCHLVFHAFMKIASFFCAGAVMQRTGKNFVYELDGLGKKLPITFTIFTVSSLALMGVPGLSGFISKWYLAQAAVGSGNILGYVGIGALLLSALLTAIYMLTIVVRAFLPGRDFNYAKVEGYSDPGIRMILPLVVFVVMIVIFGLCPTPFVAFFKKVACGEL